MFKSLLVSLLIFSFTASASESKEPPLATQLQQQLDHQLQLAINAMNNPKIIEAKAQFARNLYEALLKKGFTEEQAIKLVSGSLSSKL